MLTSIKTTKNKNTKNKSTSRAVLLGLAVVTLPLSACAGVGANYQPIIDGPITANYSQDISECRAVAQRRGYINGEVKNDALIGAVLGGLLGMTDSGNDGDNFLAGALVGGVFGGGGAALNARDERKNIVRNCMSGRGHRVVG